MMICTVLSTTVEERPSHHADVTIAAPSILPYRPSIICPSSVTIHPWTVTSSQAWLCSPGSTIWFVCLEALASPRIQDETILFRTRVKHFQHSSTRPDQTRSDRIESRHKESQMNQLTSVFSQQIIVPKLTSPHTQYRGSSGSISSPAASSSALTSSSFSLA